MAVLNILEYPDPRLRKIAAPVAQVTPEIQKLVSLMMGDTRRLQERVDNLKRHFTQTEKDLREIDTSTVQIMRRGERIQAVDMGEQPEALPKP